MYVNTYYKLKIKLYASTRNLFQLFLKIGKYFKGYNRCYLSLAVCHQLNSTNQKKSILFISTYFIDGFSRHCWSEHLFEAKCYIILTDVWQILLVIC